MFDTLYASFDFQEVDELDSGKDSPEDVFVKFICVMLKHGKMFIGVPDTWYAIYFAIMINLCVG
jgi:hypothetical protein